MKKKAVVLATILCCLILTACGGSSDFEETYHTEIGITYNDPLFVTIPDESMEITVYLDGEKIGTMNMGETRVFVTELTAGEHTIKTSRILIDKDECTFEVIKPGDNTIFSEQYFGYEYSCSILSNHGGVLEEADFPHATDDEYIYVAQSSSELPDTSPNIEIPDVTEQTNIESIMDITEAIENGGRTIESAISYLNKMNIPMQYSAEQAAYFSEDEAMWLCYANPENYLVYLLTGATYSVFDMCCGQNIDETINQLESQNMISSMVKSDEGVTMVIGERWIELVLVDDVIEKIVVFIPGIIELPDYVYNGDELYGASMMDVNEMLAMNELYEDLVYGGDEIQSIYGNLLIEDTEDGFRRVQIDMPLVPDAKIYSVFGIYFSLPADEIESRLAERTGYELVEQSENQRVYYLDGQYEMILEISSKADAVKSIILYSGIREKQLSEESEQSKVTEQPDVTEQQETTVRIELTEYIDISDDTNTISEKLRNAEVGDVLVLDEIESYSWSSNLSLKTGDEGQSLIFLEWPERGLTYEYSFLGIYCGMLKEELDGIMETLNLTLSESAEEYSVYLTDDGATVKIGLAGSQIVNDIRIEFPAGVSRRTGIPEDVTELTEYIDLSEDRYVMAEALRNAGVGDIIILGEYESYSLNSNLEIRYKESEGVTLYLSYKGDEVFEYAIYGIYAGMTREAFESTISESNLEIIEIEKIDDEFGESWERHTYRADGKYTLVVSVADTVEHVAIKCFLE